MKDTKAPTSVSIPVLSAIIAVLGIILSVGISVALFLERTNQLEKKVDVVQKALADMDARARRSEDAVRRLGMLIGAHTHDGKKLILDQQLLKVVEAAQPGAGAPLYLDAQALSCCAAVIDYHDPPWSKMAERCFAALKAGGNLEAVRKATFDQLTESEAKNLGAVPKECFP